MLFGIEEMQTRPELGADEEPIASIETATDGSTRSNVIICVTTERVIVSPKRGKSIPEETDAFVDGEIPLEEITTVRHSGILRKQIEIVTADNIFELPSAKDGSKNIVASIAEQTGLEKTDWGERTSSEKRLRGTASILSLIGSALLFLAGVACLLIGVGLIITIVGILFGLGLLVIGYGLIWCAWQLAQYAGYWGWKTREEWVHESVTY